jgi:hypothetical protein
VITLHRFDILPPSVTSAAVIPLAEIGHQAAEFRQGRNDGLFRPKEGSIATSYPATR